MVTPHTVILAVPGHELRGSLLLFTHQATSRAHFFEPHCAMCFESCARLLAETPASDASSVGLAARFGPIQRSVQSTFGSLGERVAETVSPASLLIAR